MSDTMAERAGDAPKILFWVQHLLGIGHLKRTATLARALARSGFAVTVVSGGFPVPGLRLDGAGFMQLPPVRAVDVYFKDLRTEGDRPIDDAWRETRRTALMAAAETIRPDIVLTELFPFGRRQLAFELEPFLTEMRARGVLVACSVRDILVEPPKPERLLEMLERTERLFDLVLVHGDPDLVPFEETFPHKERIGDRLAYTGYVVEEPIAAAGRDGEGEVIVSAGGGAVSEPLLRAALAAKPLSRARDLPWRLLCGAGIGEAAVRDLQRLADADTVVEPARPDFPGLLARGRLSVSQAGYNTIMDVLAAGIPGVVVPYAGGLESEQTLRARRLAERGVLHVVNEADLTPERLAAGIDRALAAPPGSLDRLATDGSAETVRLLRAALARRRA
ncbi:MAG: glycosyltransferase [Alphaproteobacteria bacterium]|nr:glycosyltransferase [Alphaproteobacteria bacterium]MCB9930153.1 glycosyltransferase [Alphaproteobacteria bacterium]